MTSSIIGTYESGKYNYLQFVNIAWVMRTYYVFELFLAFFSIEITKALECQNQNNLDYCMIKGKVVEGLGTIQWNGILVLDFTIWSLDNKKLCFLLIIQKLKIYFSITKPSRFSLEDAGFNQERLLYCTGTPPLTRFSNNTVF